MINKVISCALTLALVIVPALRPARTLSDASMSPTYIIDDAGVIDEPYRTMIDRTLRGIEEDTQAVMLILTVKSLDGTSSQDFCYEFFNEYGIGHHERNDGILCLIAPNDRETYIMLGTGLEKIITEEKLNEILDIAIENHLSGGRSDFSNAALTISQEMARFFTPLYYDFKGLQR